MYFPLSLDITQKVLDTVENIYQSASDYQ